MRHSLKLIGAADPAVPLFFVHAFHVLHTPLEVPH